MKIIELEKKLEGIGVADPKAEAHLILEHLFGVSYAKALMERDTEYDEDKIAPFIKRREAREPLQYIFGKWDFMGHSFFVSPNCLIPRPDTEILVYEALLRLKDGQSVADLCTGSGCIGISLLAEREKSNAYLADISAEALEMARKNATALGVCQRCRIELCDVTKELPCVRFDMIVSNPPYIPRADIDALSDEVKHEPLLALDGGVDGLDIVLSLIEQAPSHLFENGYLLIEFGYDQGEKIDSIMKKELARGTYKSYKIVKDYGGNDRVLVAQI